MGKVEDLEHCRCDIRQHAAFAELAVVTYHAERNRVGGVSGERLAVLLKHLVGIAVVRGDDCRAALLQNCVNNLTYAVVNRLNSAKLRMIMS